MLTKPTIARIWRRPHPARHRRNLHEQYVRARG